MSEFEDIIRAILAAWGADRVSADQAVVILREIRRHRLAEAAACERLINELQSGNVRYNEGEEFDDRGRPRFRIK